jgi:hypothetical protein
MHVLIMELAMDFRKISILFLLFFISPYVTGAEVKEIPFNSFVEYKKSVHEDKKRTLSFFSEIFLANQLSDLLESDSDTFEHNANATKNVLYFGERVNVIYGYKSSCSKKQCATEIIYSIEERDKNVNKVTLYSGANESLKIEKIVFNKLGDKGASLSKSKPIFIYKQ